MAPADARKTPNLSLVRAAPDAESDDARLVRRLRDGDHGGPAALFDRYSQLVNRVLRRVLGDTADHDDRVQETFLEVLRSVSTLRDDNALRPWVTTIAVRVARAELRRRKVRRFLRLSDDEMPEAASADDHDGRAALRLTYAILDALPIDERIAFSLRFIHGEELTAVAEACGCSLATVKRWLARAEQRFVAQAMQHPELALRLAQGGRWSPP